MLWSIAQAKVYNVALPTRIFPFSGPRSEKVGHLCFKCLKLVIKIKLCSYHKVAELSATNLFSNHYSTVTRKIQYCKNYSY